MEREEEERGAEDAAELMVKPTGETDEQIDGSPKIPARFDFFCQRYIVVVVESYKVKLATVDLRSLVFSLMSWPDSPPPPSLSLSLT